MSLFALKGRFSIARGRRFDPSCLLWFLFAYLFIIFAAGEGIENDSFLRIFAAMSKSY